MNSFLLLDANPHPSADFPEAITLNLCIAVSLRPRPVQTTHSATSQGAGPQRANTGSATWGHLHHGRCLQTSRVRGKKQEKKNYELSCARSITAQDDLSRVEFTPEFAPGVGGGKFTFNSLHTWEKKNIQTQRDTAAQSRHVSLFSSFSNLQSSTCCWL